jgi:hypothetical protein
MQDAPFKSDFAILDVKKGRQALSKKIFAGRKVRVRIDMIIDTQWGSDDGVSAEFSGKVLSIKQFAPRA